MSKFKKTKCLYLCEVHLAITMKEIQFGNALDSTLVCFDSECDYCKIRPAVVRLYVFVEHWLVSKFLEKMGERNNA